MIIKLFEPKNKLDVLSNMITLIMLKDQNFPAIHYGTFFMLVSWYNNQDIL